MDFASLVGPSAHLARQLELRWFYHWERNDAPCRPSAAATSTSVGRNGSAKPRSSQGGRRGSDDSSDVPQCPPSGGRLVRRPRHSMPFLRRNIVGAVGASGPPRRSSRDAVDGPIRNVGSLPRSEDGGDGNAKSDKAPVSREDIARRRAMNAMKKLRLWSDADVFDDDGSSSSAVDMAPPKRSGKRKRAGEGNDNACGGNTNSNEGKANSRVKKSSSASTVDPPPNESENSFQSYAQSTAARRKVLQKVPAELHHDVAFVLERMREAWLEKGRIGRSTNSTDNPEEGVGCYSGSDDNASKKGCSTNDLEQQIVQSRERSVANASVILPSTVVISTLLKAGDAKRSSAVPLRKQQKQLPPAYFHYLYMQPNNVPATFVEEIEGRKCPFCDFDGKSDEGLLDHCGRFHGTLINANTSPAAVSMGGDGAIFEAALGEDGQLHVVVRGIPTNSSGAPPADDQEDFVFVSSRPRGNVQKSRTNIPFLQRSPHKVAALDGAAREKKLLGLQANDAPASAISAYLPSDKVPVRQYFHARTNLPMTHGEWMNDSDEEGDGEAHKWMREMHEQLLEEFEDVSPREKTFMKLWNRFIKSNHVIVDRDIPGKCHEFVLKHREKLHEGDLRLNLLLHLFNLWDSGVISSDRVLSIMSMFDGANAGAIGAIPMGEVLGED